MSVFLQSAGKQFVRSPGRWRDAIGAGGLVEYSQNLNFMERTAVEVRFQLFLPNLFDSHIFPADPFPADPGELGARVFPRWYREQNNPVFTLPGGYLGNYERFYGDNADSYPGGQPVTPINPATRDQFFWMTGRNTYRPPYANSQNHSWDLSPIFAPSNTFPLDRKALQGSAANGHVASYEYYPTVLLSNGTVRPEAFSGQRARFRVLFNSPGWIGRTTRTVTWTFDNLGTAYFNYQFMDWRFIQNAPVAAGVWNEVPHPLALISDLSGEEAVRNQFYFWLYAETPEAWQARTGIPLAGA